MIAIDATIVSNLMAAVVRAATTAAGFVALMVVTIGPGPWACESPVFDTQRERFRVNTLVRGLEHPWSLAFLPGGDTIIHAERMLEGVLGRIRDVRTGTDGYIYLLTDQADGVLARLEPV
jgi:glucose/arabinose dehydrogenase